MFSCMQFQLIHSSFKTLPSRQGHAKGGSGVPDPGEPAHQHQLQHARRRRDGVEETRPAVADSVCVYRAPEQRASDLAKRPQIGQRGLQLALSPSQGIAESFSCLSRSCLVKSHSVLSFLSVKTQRESETLISYLRYAALLANGAACVVHRHSQRVLYMETVPCLP